MNLQFRLAKSEDIEKVLELQSSSIQLMSADYNPRQIETLVRSQTSARLYTNEKVFLASYKDELVGFACLIDNSFEFGGFLIGGVYVHPNFLRQGIGTQLLEVIEKTAIEKGCKVLPVMSSLTASNFYKARGYQVIRQSDRYFEVGVRISCLILKKSLIPKKSVILKKSSIPVTKPENFRQRINFFYSRLKPFFPAISLMILCMIGILLVQLISLLKNLLP
jgi:putative acetyltransferase